MDTMVVGFGIAPARVWGGQRLLHRTGSRCSQRGGAAGMRAMASKSDSKVRPNIVVLGGGFGGLYTTLHLMSMPWSRLQKPRITLVDKSDRFVFLPLLYELLTGTMTSSEIAPYFDELLHNTNVKFVRGDIKRLNAKDKSVFIDVDNDEDLALNYDRLVVATGANAMLDMIPGAKEHAYPFYRIDDAIAVKERLRELKNSSRSVIKVAVVGAGYTGVELATTVAEVLGERGSVSLLSRGDSIMDGSKEHNRKVALSAIRDFGIHLETGAQVDSVSKDSLKFTKDDEQETMEVDLVLCTAGSRPTALKGFGSLPQTDKGQLQTTKTLQIKDNEDIFAVGDIAECIDQSTKKPTKPTAQSALQQADYAAWNLYASIAKESSLPFRYLDLGEMMCLGSNNAAISALNALNLEGKAAATMRRAVYVARMPTDLHRLRTTASWTSRPVVSKANNVIADLLRSVDL